MTQIARVLFYKLNRLITREIGGLVLPNCTLDTINTFTPPETVSDTTMQHDARAWRGGRCGTGGDVYVEMLSTARVESELHMSPCGQIARAVLTLHYHSRCFIAHFIDNQVLVLFNCSVIDNHQKVHSNTQHDAMWGLRYWETYILPLPCVIASKT